MKKLYRFSATAIVSFLLYVLLTMSFSLPEVLLGVGTALITSLIVVRYLPFSFALFHPKRIFHAILYTPIFIWKMIAANIHIAGIVIRPRLPVRPSIVRAKTESTTAVGKLLLTSSITLTPGTLSVDTDDDTIYIHVVDSHNTSDDAARENIIKPFEPHIKGISE